MAIRPEEVPQYNLTRVSNAEAYIDQQILDANPAPGFPRETYQISLPAFTNLTGVDRSEISRRYLKAGWQRAEFKESREGLWIELQK